ncbi:MAG: PilZ domain-containing protein [Candidatus Omnitrophota bacterium]
MNETQEKRRCLRVELKVDLGYKDLKKLSNSPITVMTTNLGEGGVRFQSDQFISLACRLIVEIKLSGSQKPIKAISKVAWIKKLPLSDRYDIGNQFLEISKEDRENVANFVNKLATPSM